MPDDQAPRARRNLVVVRAGDESRHKQWVTAATERNFDLFVSYFGELANPIRGELDFYEAVPGMKWPRLHQLYTEQRELLLSYDACWFPDDDLSTDSTNLNAMFDSFHAYDLWLAQPALDAGSHVNVQLTARVPGVRLRFTNFAEVMCPIFSRDCLALLAHTFRESFSGWGLDYLWPHLLGYPRDRIAILDATPVVHPLRPAGSGSNYQRCAENSIVPLAEWRRILREHAIPPAPRTSYSTLTEARP